ncbi:MAG TPA: hypothetical protein VEU07_02495, partial [Candidatus Acidoferrum sp.]|nr:hypothetical protein [Candidatus Acidoferrum sp.]
MQEVCFGLLDLKRLARVLSSTQLEAVRDALKRHGGAGAGLLARTTSRAGAAENEPVPPPKEPVGFRI